MLIECLIFYGNDTLHTTTWTCTHTPSVSEVHETSPPWLLQLEQNYNNLSTNVLRTINGNL